MWAEKSTEKPMHMIRLIIDIESRLTPHRVMKPTTPNSIDMILKATQREQIGFGIRTSETTIITTAATLTHWIVVGNTIRNWSKKIKYGWNVDTLNGDAWHTARSSSTKTFSSLASLIWAPWIRNRAPTMCSPSSEKSTSVMYCDPEVRYV